MLLHTHSKNEQDGSLTNQLTEHHTEQLQDLYCLDLKHIFNVT